MFRYPFATAALATFAMTIGFGLTVLPLGNHAKAFHTDEQLHMALKNLSDRIGALESRVEALEADPGPAGRGTSFLLAILPLTNGDIDGSEWDSCTSVHGGRPANSQDVLTLPWDPTTGPAEAWVRPYIVASEGINGLVDISGVTGGLNDIACGDVVDDRPWTSPASLEKGLVAMNGAAAIRPCNLEFRILCVAPEPTPDP